MIPIHDTLPSRRYPVVNYGLILLNVLFFLIQLAQGRYIDQFIYIYGLVPARYTVPEIAAYFSFGRQIFSFLSFMFLHGGVLHLLGNMWFLHVFGDNVEDHFGPFRYLVFYILCGVTSGVAHLLLNAYSNVPTIGASGAIAGVMGAYFILYPTARVLTLIPIIFIPYFVEIPAFFFLALWFVLQFLNAAGSHADVSGVAWWAHIGGFVFGILILKGFDRLPGSGATDRVRPSIERKRTRRIQTIRPTGREGDPNLYGVMRISPYEAVAGSRKRVNIPWSFHNRMYRIETPPGVRDGKILRLKGMGKAISPGQRGDLMLKVIVGDPDENGGEEFYRRVSR
jgi:membrane associated rhomboid family serine protease